MFRDRPSVPGTTSETARTSIRTPPLSRAVLDQKRLKALTVPLAPENQFQGLSYELATIRGFLDWMHPSAQDGASLLEATKQEIDSLIGSRRVLWYTDQQGDCNDDVWPYSCSCTEGDPSPRGADPRQQQPGGSRMARVPGRAQLGLRHDRQVPRRVVLHAERNAPRLQ